jgi:hypothetical protein
MAAVVPAALVLVLQLFVFGPAALYVHNAPEFWTPLPRLLLLCAVPASVLLAGLVGLGAVLPARARPAYTVLLLAVAALLWIQGNLLVWDYGLLDGRPIAWGEHTWPNGADAVLWVCLPVGALVFARRLAPHASFAAAVLLALSVGSLALDLAASRGTGGPRPAGPPPPETFEYSSGANIVHVVLDAFQGDVFGEVVARDGLADDLDGFVWFRNHLGAFPSTYMAVPVIFANRVYANEGRAAEFFADALSRHAFWNRLHDEGWRVHLIPSWPVHPCAGKYTTCWPIPDPYDALDRVPVRDALVLLDLTLFRHAPHVLKRFVHRDERWLLRRLLPRDVPPGVLFNQRHFLEDYAARIRVVPGPPTYHLIHLMPPHFPYVADRQCGWVDVQPLTREAYADQAACALRMFRELMDALRARDIYDASLVVLQSDHGGGQRVSMRNVPAHASGGNGTLTPEVVQSRVAAAALALLAVKLPHATGPLVVSDAPSALGDIGATVLRAAGLPAPAGAPSVFELRPEVPRLRVFHAYAWENGKWRADFLGPIQRYEVRGDVYDLAAWRAGEVVLEADGGRRSARVDLGTPEASYHLVRGWGAEEVYADGSTVAWALGGSAAVALPLPPGRAARLTARLLAFPLPGRAQRVDVRLDGEPAGAFEVREDDWQLREYSLVLPPAHSRRATSLIEFGFSHFQEPARPGEVVRPLAALFDWIKVEEIE